MLLHPIRALVLLQPSAPGPQPYTRQLAAPCTLAATLCSLQVEDVLLAHIGLVSTLRSTPLGAVGARVRHPKHGLGTVQSLMSDGRTVVHFDTGGAHRSGPVTQQLVLGLNAESDADATPASTDVSAASVHSKRVCARLKVNEEDLSSWMAENSKVVEHQLRVLSWQSWATDNQIIASVQTLMDQCAVPLTMTALSPHPNLTPTSP